MEFSRKVVTTRIDQPSRGLSSRAPSDPLRTGLLPQMGVLGLTQFFGQVEQTK